MKTLKKLTMMSLKPLMLFSLAAVLLTACKKDNIDTGNQDAAAINVVNASPGTLAFNFYLDNQLVNGPALGFTEQSGYILAYSGNRVFDIAQVGSNTSSLKDTLNLQTDKYYTVFVAGQTSALTTVVTEDDMSAPATNKARIRFIQLSPDAGALDFGFQGSANLFSDIAFKGVSSFTEVDPAAVTVELRNDGTVLSSFAVTLQAGKIYTFWSRGLMSGTGSTAIGLTGGLNN